MEISLVSETADSKLIVNPSSTKTELWYPCSKVDQVILTEGIYSIHMCGGNGGVPQQYQIDSVKSPDTPYTVGCSNGVFTVRKKTKFFITLGGHGEYAIKSSSRTKGGYNGGGRGNQEIGAGCSGGGEANDLRAEVNDVCQRIFVAGGGGGRDDIYGGDTPSTNDGCGGSGGGLVAKGWFSSRIVTFPVANETFGFSFGQGEGSSSTGCKHIYGSKTITPINYDVGGAGGGWFGGFASHGYVSGAGGGSSFALTNTANIPTTVLEEINDDYSIKSSGYYVKVTHERGV